MKRHWMPLYIADYLADTAHLTAAEHGAYLLLIMHLWANGTLPSSDAELVRRISRMSRKEWNRSRETIQAFFYDGWKHSRVEREMEEAQRLSRAGSIGGKASADKRRAKKANGSATIVERPVNGHDNDTPTPTQRTFNDPPSPTVTVTDTKNTTTESESVAAREGVVLAVRIVKIYTDLGLEPVPDTGRAHLWISQGYRPDIVAAVIADNLRQTKALKPLAYFDKPIARAHERVPATTLGAEPQRTADPDEKTQHLLAQTWLHYLSNGEDRWPLETPAPGKPGCKISAEILRQHGIDPDSGKRLEVQTS